MNATGEKLVKAAFNCLSEFARGDLFLNIKFESLIFFFCIIFVILQKLLYDCPPLLFDSGFWSALLL